MKNIIMNIYKAIMASNIDVNSYTRNIPLQMLLIVLLLAIACIWQHEVIYQIYVANQVNAVGWGVNGGIMVLFVSGMLVLIRRFSEYRTQEQGINRFITNVNNSADLLLGIRQDCMVAQRFLTLKNLHHQKANVNQGALAATLLASESSRNSFLKFVHNVLILTGVFGTIISLSISLLGASEILQSGGQAADLSANRGDHSAGLGTMIFGMSTALSTTLTAIVAYLFFGYFYIKLTDTQTFLISKIEEVTTTTLMPHLHLNQEAIVLEYSDSIRSASDLIKKLDRSQKIYADSAAGLESSAALLSEKVSKSDEVIEGNKEQLALMQEIVALQQQNSKQSADDMASIVSLLKRGFRLK